jgi:hypothetical protein
MKAPYQLSIVIESNMIQPNGRGSNLVERDDDCLPSLRWRESPESFPWGVEKSTTSMRTGSDDANGDTCTFFLSGNWLGRGFAMECSWQEMDVVEAASLSFTSRLPSDQSRSSSNGSLGEDQNPWCHRYDNLSTPRSRLWWSARP